MVFSSHACNKATRLLAMGLCCLGFAAGLHAEAAAPWIQVELIVWRNLDAGAGADEAWPPNPALAYPKTIQILDDPLGTSATGMPDPVGNTQDIDNAILAEEGIRQTPVGITEKPFVLLGASTGQLLDAAQRIAGSQRHRLLLHALWRQPDPDAAHPSDVLLTGGEPHGGHFELEGYISLKRSLFHHLETRLWLNDFADNGTAPGIALPPLPSPAPALLPLNAVSDDSLALATSGTAPDVASLPSVAEAIPPISASRSVVMARQARIEMGKLHYLDHPLFGLLLRITAYDPAATVPVTPEPQQTAQ